MAAFRIDIERVRLAQGHFSSFRDQISFLASKHRSQSDDIMSRLWNERNGFLHVQQEMDRLWERFGYNAPAGEVDQTREQIEELQGEAQRAVSTVSEAHEGRPRDAIQEESQGHAHAFTQAISMLRTAANTLSYSHFDANLTNPGHVADVLHSATQCLSATEREVVSFLEFLRRLEQDERDLLNEVERLTRGNGLRATSVCPVIAATSILNTNPQRGAQTIAVQTGPMCSTQLTELPLGKEVAAIAAQYAGWLNPGPSRDFPGARAFDVLDMKKVPQSEQAAANDALSYWNKLYGQGNDIECVAFVRLVYAVRGINLPQTGDANEWINNFKGKVGWTEIQNGKGLPQPGDIIVLDGTKTNSYGHVAIITAVDHGQVSFAQGNADTVTGSLPINTTTGAINGNVLGFIRYIGSTP